MFNEARLNTLKSNYNYSCTITDRRSPTFTFFRYYLILHEDNNHNYFLVDDKKPGGKKIACSTRYLLFLDRIYIQEYKES